MPPETAPPSKPGPVTTTAARRRVIRNHIWKGINGHPDDPECGICHEPVDDHADQGEWGS